MLTTTLDGPPERIVALYSRRMQIEESFRDTKNHRWGWSLRHCRSRSELRLETLLLLAAIASVIQHLIGIAAEKKQMHRHHQANTIRSRRVLSFFLLGAFVIARREHLNFDASTIHGAIAALRRKIKLLHSQLS